MKNLLIASSMLAMTAGFAAADTTTTFSGTLMFGLANNGTGNGGNSDNGPGNGGANDSVLPNDTYHVYSNIDLIATIAGTSDSGLSFGTSVDMSAGPDYVLANDDGFNDNDGTFSSPAIFVTGSFGTVTFKSNDISFYDDSAWNGGGDGGLLPGVNDGSNNGDFKYEGTFGGFFVGLITDIESGDMSAKTSYTLGGVALEADYSMDANGPGQSGNTSGGLWNASAGYTWSTINFAFTADNDTDDNNVEYGLKVGTTVAGIDAWAKYNFHPEVAATSSAALVASYSSYDVGATYTTGPASVTVEADNVTEENTSNGIEWTVTGAYELASGVTFQAGMNYTGDMMLGAKFAF